MSFFILTLFTVLSILLFLTPSPTTSNLFTSTSGTGYLPNGDLGTYQDCSTLPDPNACRNLVVSLSLPSFAGAAPSSPSSTILRLNAEFDVSCEAFTRMSGAQSEDLTSVTENFEFNFAVFDLTEDPDCLSAVAVKNAVAGIGNSLNFPTDFPEGWRMLVPGHEIRIRAVLRDTSVDPVQELTIDRDFQMESYLRDHSVPATPLSSGAFAVQNWRMRYVEVNTPILDGLVRNDLPTDVPGNQYSIGENWAVVDSTSGALVPTANFFDAAGDLAGESLVLSGAAVMTAGDRWVLVKNLKDAANLADPDNYEGLIVEWWEEIPKFDFAVEGMSGRPASLEGPLTLRLVLDSTEWVEYVTDPEATVTREWECVGCSGQLIISGSNDERVVFNDALAELTPDQYEIRGRACVGTACSPWSSFLIDLKAEADSTVVIDSTSLPPSGVLEKGNPVLLSFSAKEDVLGVGMDESRRRVADKPSYNWFIDDVEWVPPAEQLEAFVAERGKFADLNTAAWAPGSEHEVTVKVDDPTRVVSASVTVRLPAELAAEVTVDNAGRATYDEPTDSNVRGYSYAFEDIVSSTRRTGGSMNVASPSDAPWKQLRIQLSDRDFAKTTDVLFPRGDMNVVADGVDPAGDKSLKTVAADTSFTVEPSYDLSVFAEDAKWDFLQRSYHASYNPFCLKCFILDGLSAHATDIFNTNQDDEYAKGMINLLYRTLKSLDELSIGDSTRRDVVAPSDEILPTCEAGVPGNDNEDPPR